MCPLVTCLELLLLELVTLSLFESRVISISFSWAWFSHFLVIFERFKLPTSSSIDFRLTDFHASLSHEPSSVCDRRTRVGCWMLPSFTLTKFCSLIGWKTYKQVTLNRQGRLRAFSSLRSPDSHLFMIFWYYFNFDFVRKLC